jgi:Fe-S-cluster formation regulator IscX/YfhJ
MGLDFDGELNRSGEKIFEPIDPNGVDRRS